MGKNEGDDKGVCTLNMTQPQQDVDDDQDDAEGQMMPLGREAILGMDDLPIREVGVRDWKTTVHVRTLTGAERDAFEDAVQTAQQDGRLHLTGLKARLVVLTACDAHGVRLFGDEDVDALNAKSAAAINVLFEVAQQMNGLTARDVEEMVEN